MTNEKNRPGGGHDPESEARQDASRDLDALLAGMAGDLGVAWRPGDDPSALLAALEDAGGALPEALQEVLATVLDAAGALERGLASRRGSGKDG